MKLNEKILPQIRFKLIDEPTGQKYGGQYTSYYDIYGKLSDILQFDHIHELKDTIEVLNNMLDKAIEYRESLDKRNIYFKGENNMKKYNVEFDITEIVKLIAICNSAFVSEENTLRNLNGASQTIIDNTKMSIEKIWKLKTKLKSIVNSQYANTSDISGSSKTMEEFKSLITGVNKLRDRERLMTENFEKSTCELSEVFHQIIKCALEGRHCCRLTLDTCPELYAKTLENMGFTISEERNWVDVLCGYKIYWD